MWTRELEIATGRREVVMDITPQVSREIAELGDGLLHIFLPHATAGLAVMEVGSGSDADLLDRLDALLPRSESYRHRHSTPGHGRDHILPALISPSMVLSVRRGQLDLGTWQSLVVVDTNVDNPVRHVRLSFIPG